MVKRKTFPTDIFGLITDRTSGHLDTILHNGDAIYSRMSLLNFLFRVETQEMFTFLTFLWYLLSV